MNYKIIREDIDLSGDIIEQILISRGITDVYGFINASEETVLNNYLLDNMAAGIQLLMKHLDNDSKIFLQVDSDCDGITSSAIFYQYLHDIKPDVKLEWRLHKGKEHGVIVDTVPSDTNLVVIIDAGSNQYEEHKKLKSMGIDILIIDHHEAPYETPDAVIINNQLSEKYSNKAICGAAMAWKFCQCLDDFLGSSYADKYADLMALGLIADMMDIREPETKYLISYGLKNINNNFLKELIKKQSYSIKHNPPSMIDISFYIAPLINALIRVGKMEEKEVMFNAFVRGHEYVQSTKRGAKQEVETLAEQAARNCVNARNRQNKAKEEALQIFINRIKENHLDEHKVLFVEYNQTELNSNLTGLVAMQLVSYFKKPTIVAKSFLEEGKNYYGGSARGFDGSALKDFKKFLNESNLFAFAEGHPQAFGLKIDENNIDTFLQYADVELADVDFSEGVYEVDLILDWMEIKPEYIYKIGSSGELWGTNVREPMIAIENIPLTVSNVDIIGKDRTTVKLSINGVEFIRFKDSQFAQEIEDCLESGETNITIIGRCGINEYYGKTTPQVIISAYELTP